MIMILFSNSFADPTAKDHVGRRTTAATAAFTNALDDTLEGIREDAKEDS